MVQVNNTPITLRVKFFKKGRLQYISHLDLVRTMMKIIVRAKLPLWYTEGFNPKPKITFAAPLSIGTESMCEFMDIRLTEKMPAEEAMRRLNENMTDDELAAGLVELAECGATLCDVMGDFYAPCADELAMDKDAVKKQMELIDRLHNVGADVLMSSHVLKFTPAERVLEIALEHQKRGADICKIVTGSKTMEEQIENLRITNLLKENLEIPFLFLAGGESYISRRMGFAFGNCMTLCVHEYDELSTAAQPLLRDMKTLHNLF